jgi:uncharacterized protein YndB with AHSA1/START domain
MIQRPPPADDVRYDQTRVTVLVEVPPELAFQIFTEDIDRWWRRGLRYRIARGRDGTIHLEPGIGGRLYESFRAGGDTELRQTGTVTAWEPPRRLAFDWRAVNFAPGESTQVEVAFEPTRSGTRVTVTHSGWSRMRADHPVRHGLDPEAFLRSMGLWWGDLLGSLREACGQESIER